jgi:serine/threonine protein phosphatase PrpC
MTNRSKSQIKKKSHKVSMNGYGMTDKGVRRTSNQDSILVDNDLMLYIVADGMGGHAKGEIASREAVNAIHDFIKKEIVTDGIDTVGNDSTIISLVSMAIQEAHRNIYGQSGDEIMGTTLTFLLFRDERVILAHVGDSRVYRIRGRTMEKLTKDHTQVQNLVDLGMLTDLEAENHRLSHALTRAVGAREAVKPDVSIFDVGDSDIFLLSSDGLFRVLNVDAASKILMSSISAKDKCEALMKKTIVGGAPDNVSVIVVEAKKRSLMHRILRKRKS